LIIEGAVIEEYPNGSTEYHDTGELLNIASLLLKKKALTKLTTSSDVELRLFQKECLEQELEVQSKCNIQFKKDLFKSSVANLRKIYEDTC
jgi:hypothetical protein